MPTNGPDARGDALWMACASTSLPVPLSPVTSTLESERAAASASCSRRRSDGAWPIRSPNE